ncbi:hypothetical protein [Escherichia sp. E2562]|uniref:hypothetical protein n=1 Tax=Escherichia sp. E2562 TaxID=2041646 RepID=UPI001F0E3799|nr:hypothetical protein [Escherichia sp. E2562]
MIIYRDITPGDSSTTITSVATITSGTSFIIFKGTPSIATITTSAAISTNNISIIIYFHIISRYGNPPGATNTSRTTRTKGR